MFCKIFSPRQVYGNAASETRISLHVRWPSVIETKLLVSACQLCMANIMDEINVIDITFDLRFQLFLADGSSAN
jgi:hypothetical protein